MNENNYSVTANAENEEEKNIEILELFNTQRQLEETLDYYADYFDFAPVGLITFNEKGIIKDINITCTEMIGVGKKNLINLSLINFIPNEDHKKFYNHFKECKELNKKVITELTLKLKHKPLMHVELQTIPAQDYLNKKIIFRSAIIDITKRKENEERISKLAAIVEASNDAIFSTDLKANITAWNKGAKNIFGYDASEVMGKSIYIFIPSDKKDELEISYKKIKKGETIDHFETIRIKKDGEKVYVSKSMFPIKNENGEITGVSIISRDVTKQKLAQLAERESSERFRQLAENIKAAFYITDTEAKRIIYVSPAYKDIFEVSADEIVSNPNLGRELIHPDDKERILRKIDERNITFKFDEKFRIITKSGKIKWIHSRSFPVKDKSGKVYRIAGISEDITKAKRIEQALMESELRFRKAVSHFPDVFIIYNSKEEKEFINESGIQLIGLGKKEILNLKDEELFSLEITKQYIPALKMCFDKKIFQLIECNFDNDKSKLVFEIKFVPLLDNDGNILQVLSIFHDITDRKERERFNSSFIR